MSALIELAERCEQAAGPDRDLNIAMLPLVGLRFVDEGPPIGQVCYDNNGGAVPMPSFTASIDAALTLLPEGQEWTLVKATYGPVLVLLPSGDDRVPDIKVYAKTPATAICASALRARAAGECS